MTFRWVPVICASAARWLAGLLLCWMLVGCGGGSDSGQRPSPAQADKAVDTSGVDASASEKIIDNEDLSPGLRGVDANRNGIRDDIDRLIAQKYARTPEIQRAAEQKARALQRNIEATTREEALRAGDAVERAAECAYQTLPHQTREQVQFREDMSKDIEALTANTEERFRAYWAANRLMSGAVFRQPDGRVCD